MMDRRDRENGAADLVGGMVLSGVISAAIALILVGILSSPLPGKIPSVDIELTNTTDTIFLTHKGGDNLPAGEYKIFIAGQDQTPAFTKRGAPAGDWFVGDTLAYHIPVSGMPDSFTIVYEGSGNPQALITIYV